MTDMILRGLPDALHEAIRLRAEAHGTTPEAEAEAILHDAMFETRLKVILRQQGLGPALLAIGQEVGGVELDVVRDRSLPRIPDFG